MKELSKSTSNLMTGGISMPKFLKKPRPKSDSKASLLRKSTDSLATISVNNYLNILMKSLIRTFDFAGCGS